MSGLRYPSWKFRYFRLRAVDHCGYDDWYFGIAFHPLGDFAHGRRELSIMLGHRQFYFDLGAT